MSDVAMPGLQGLAGELRITPGAPPPHGVQSSRQDWAARMGHGVPAASLPGLMASLFNLCGHSHRLCSQLAIGAAAPGLLPTPANVAERLRRETAMEHVRRMGLDWPRLLAPAHSAQANATLRTCPPLAQDTTPDPWRPLQRWLQQDLLRMPASEWLAAWQVGRADWLATWSQCHRGWLPGLLREARAADTATPLSPTTALRPHADGPGLCRLGEALALTPALALRPQWDGACAHTGPWSRIGQTSSDLPLTPWGLLGARLAELARLVLDGGGATLGWGAVSTGPNRGLAWVEMARGLLVHQVEVDPATGRVLACRVVAPTEWNFHPHGEVAQRVARIAPDLPEAERTRQVNLLVAAFDPCVPFTIERLAATSAQARETGHA